MNVAISGLPAGFTAQVMGSWADVSFGDPKAPTVIRAATDGTSLTLFPDRSYKHADLVKALGLAG